jgi:archaea-specific DNA-binding protein
MNCTCLSVRMSSSYIVLVNLSKLIQELFDMFIMDTISVVCYLLDLNYTKAFTTLMSEAQPQQNQQVQKEGTHDAIYIGKKPLMAYVTSTLIQLANQPSVTIKARGLSIGRAVDVSQIILKRMENAGYKIGDVRIGSETVQSEDGRTRNVSTIEIEIKRGS